MNIMPEWYMDDIARVSKIVEFVYPFEWDGKQRYLDWLADNVPEKRKRGFSIDEEEYMKEAQDVGTFVHLQMENRINWDNQDVDNPLYTLHKEEIEHWLDYIDNLTEEWWEFLTEVYVRDLDDRYQGSIDLVLIHHEKKLIKLFDWKTWGIAKKRYNMPNKYSKPYSKLKKLSLQLSLYANTYIQKWYKIEWIYWVWLHDTWAYEFKLPLISSEEIDDILIRYFIKDNIPDIPDLIINIENMIIEIQSPTWLQYEYVNIKVDTTEDKRDIKEIVKDIADVRTAQTLELIRAKNDINKAIENGSN